MSIPFAKARDPKLGLTDKLTFGKLKDCRICDVIQDHYEYLIWANKQGFVQFQKEVTDLIEEQANFKRWEGVEEGDSQDDVVKDTYEKFMGWDDDIPF
jgi:uncharacterized protein (DUF3820 family)